MALSISTVIHQTWRFSEVPERWRGFQQSWLGHHPAWEYRLWTDLALRQLIVEHYPWFLSIYDNYPEHIQRVDAARYFIMHRCGGVYVDLDFECLRPLDSILSEEEVVLGFEPAAHLSKEVVRAQGIGIVVGNAFLASSPGHKFWDHVFLELVGSHHLIDPLISTGPFLLSRALKTFANSGSIKCIPAEVMYPGTSEEAERGQLIDASWRRKNADQAYAIHHWSGSWIKDQSKPRSRAEHWYSAKLVDRGKPVFEGNVAFDQNDGQRGLQSLVSCLMVTRSERLDLARRAIACFQAQTHSRKELIIVADGHAHEIEERIESLADERIRLIHLSDDGHTLGRLRNVAVSHARGDYVMQWDDDDLYHPRRIEMQLSAVMSLGADACLLSRWQIWWPKRQRIATSKKRAWEGSLLCAREHLPKYDETKRRGEDTPVVLRLASNNKVIFLDAPRLYAYVVHEKNTTPQQQLDEHWAQATDFAWGKNYADRLRALAAELPECLHGELLADTGSSDDMQTTVAASAPATAASEVETLIMRGARVVATSCAFSQSNDKQKILILSPVKNGKPFIKSYFSNLEKLDYPRDRISLALLESDSTDGTYDELKQAIQQIKSHFTRVELFKRDYQYHLSGSRSDANMQLQRRSILARGRNYLISRALRDENAVLWLDFDVIDYPADVLDRLLSHDKDVVVPHCVLAKGGRTFDLNTFIEKNGTGNAAGAENDALLQPQRGQGRKYLEDVRDRDLIEVHSVGGTVLFVKADLHREGVLFPITPYKQRLETEGFAQMARDMGFSCWGLPNVEVIHANH